MLYAAEGATGIKIEEDRWNALCDQRLVRI
jgi:hypothetical protein